LTLDIRRVYDKIANAMDEIDEQTMVPGEVVADDGGSEVDPLSDPEERRVLYSALDSFR